MNIDDMSLSEILNEVLQRCKNTNGRMFCPEEQIEQVVKALTEETGIEFTGYEQ